MTTPLRGAAARRAQREERPSTDAEMKKRKSATELPEESDSSREKRAALQQMMMAGASPGGITGRASAVVVADAPIADVESESEGEEEAEAAQAPILLSPQERAREIDVRIRLAEEEAVRNAINGADLLRFISVHHANPKSEEIIGMWQRAEGQEQALSRETVGYFQYLLAMSLGKFQENRRDYPTPNPAYQNAKDPVIIAACKIELLKVIDHLYSQVSRFSQSYMHQKVLASQQAFARFEVMLQVTLSKFPRELLSQIQETLETDNDDGKARLRGMYALSRPDIDIALDKLFAFFSEAQNASFRPLFTDKYVQAIHIKLNQS